MWNWLFARLVLTKHLTADWISPLADIPATDTRLPSWPVDYIDDYRDGDYDCHAPEQNRCRVAQPIPVNP
jgi:hypothetical protein